MKRLSKIVLLLLLTISISSCKLMPYRSDFDCPIPEGIKCKSLYEVNKMAGHRQVKRDVNLSIERLKGMIYRIAVTIYQ
ncbi:MAG: conjugal transfer protein TraV [Rickettsia endosymbiont of Argas persicus]